MRAAPAALVFIASAALTSAARIKSHAVLEHKGHAKLGWLDKRQKFCTGKPAKLECDEKSIIMVKTAFYNRAKAKEEDCAPKETSEKSCEVDTTSRMAGKCNGQTHCYVEPTAHPWCSEAPFTMFRVVWECIAGSPGTAVEDAQLTVNTPEEEEEEEEEEMEEMEEEEEEEEEEVIPKKKVGESVKKEVDELVGNTEAEANFKPCFRLTRESKVKGSWTNWTNWVDPLTNCPKQEGCFKVIFPDGKVYTDPEEPPTPQALLTANYVKGQDSFWVTFFSTGLKRNDHDTWGVCLPKGDGIDFAIATFNRLKAER